MIKVLGIETSCDETSASVVLNGKKVISCVTASQIKIHKIYGGVVPEIASRKHIENIKTVVEKSIKTAKLNLNEIDLIAVTSGPGLVGSLLVGINFAKGLSFSLKKPLVAVNHLKAHVAANYLNHKDLAPPFLALIISGGHTNIVLVKSYTEFSLIGKTIDDSIGETFDKIGRILKINYPAGPKIDSLSKLGDCLKYSFPKPKIKNSEFNFSFSGLKTAVINKIREEELKNKNFKIEDITASFQEIVCKILCEKVFLAAEKMNQKKLVVCGGVCANSKIRSSLKKEAEKNGINLFLPNLKYCTDNAAMVASQGFFEFKTGNFEKDFSLNAISKISF